MQVKEDASLPQGLPRSPDDADAIASGESRLVSGWGLDSPTGQYIHIPSGINHQPIRYFIPDPLRDLLTRCGPTAPVDPPEDDSRIHAAAFLHLVARRGYAGVYDPMQAGLLFDLLWQTPPPIESTADALAIAARIDSRAQDIRRQIVFTGSRIASDALHVYAPHEAVPGLMEQLIEGIRYDDREVAVVDRVSVLGFFCVHAHPFRDGNGRWTRALTLTVERRSLLTAMAAMSFQTLCMKPLSEAIWPQTRAQGLRAYLAACRAYTLELLTSYGQSKAFASLQGVDEALRSAAHTSTKYRTVARSLFVEGRLEAEEAKQVLGVSSRVVNGLFRALEDNGLMASQQGISTSSLLDEIARQADTAAALALASMKERKG